MCVEERFSSLTSAFCQVEICTDWSSKLGHKRTWGITLHLNSVTGSSNVCILTPNVSKCINKDVPPKKYYFLFSWICSTHPEIHYSHNALQSRRVDCLMVHSSDHQPYVPYLWWDEGDTLGTMKRSLQDIGNKSWIAVFLLATWIDVNEYNLLTSWSVGHIYIFILMNSVVSVERGHFTKLIRCFSIMLGNWSSGAVSWNCCVNRWFNGCVPLCWLFKCVFTVWYSNAPLGCEITQFKE